ncbi:MAG: response regulator [candidate division Zixibacteria bacterium]|nr:response regulator [candidate division Zixibacteria bacterium]
MKRLKKILLASERQESVGELKNILGQGIEISPCIPEKIQDLTGYDLILYDWSGDDLDCLANIINLRTLCKFKDIPIIILAGQSRMDYANKALTSGATDIVEKPYTEDSIKGAIKKALKPLGSEFNIEPQIIRPFIQATSDVMREFLSVKAKRQDIYLKKDNYLFGDITAIMKVSGDTEGIAAVTMHMELASMLVAKITGMNERDMGIDVITDGMSEIINQVAGRAGLIASETEYKFDISLPEIIAGYGNQVEKMSREYRDLPIITIVFECLNEPLAIQLCLKALCNGRKPIHSTV